MSDHDLAMRGAHLMREDGYTLIAIAREFGVSERTVYRWLKDKTVERPSTCAYCGTPIKQPIGRGRPRRFCGAKCASTYRRLTASFDPLSSAA